MAITMSAGKGVAFMVGGTLMADFIAKACSSPQTAELNAGKRSPTLNKWVNMGIAEGALFIVIAASLEPPNRTAILAGGILEAVITYYQYQYAKKSGIANPGNETEDWGDSDGNQVNS